MILFKTNNNLHMLYSQPYNWRVEPVYVDLYKPIYFWIDVEIWDDSICCGYDPLKEILTINGIIKIDVKTFEEASKLVGKIVKGSKKENRIGEIYKLSPTNIKTDKRIQNEFDNIMKEYKNRLRERKLKRIIKDL